MAQSSLSAAMIDTHSHLLPGLDDGARDMTQALAMARASAEAGVRLAVCTPHLKDDPAGLLPAARAALNDMKRNVAANEIALDLTLGFELDLNLLMEAEPDLIDSCTFGYGRPVMLLETPYNNWPKWAEQAIFDLRLRGILPILAHPERNERFQRHPERLSDLVHQGIVLQITVPSVVGAFGRHARNTALKLVASGEVALLASDIHFRRLETAMLREGVGAIRTALPSCDVDILVAENPRRLLSGEELLPLSPAKGRDRWLARFRKLMR